MNDLSKYTALASESRLTIMHWLKEPQKHFPVQSHADIVETGVCCTFLTNKLGIAPATTTRHMNILKEANLVKATRIGKYTYYKRIDSELFKLAQNLQNL